MNFSGRIPSFYFIIFLQAIGTVVSLASAHSTSARNTGSEGALYSSDSPVSTVSKAYTSLESLFEGNKRFRNVAGKRDVAISQLVEEPPSFMFLGCTDNRLSPASIFQAPVGSIVTQNNIGNQYSQKDTSTDAAVTYAIEELGVQHIIVLGHYGCPGIARAIARASKSSWFSSTSFSKWISPIVKAYKRERRTEVVKFRDSRMPRRGLPNGITDIPQADEQGFRALVEENVKNTVSALKTQSILAQAYATGPKIKAKHAAYDVYVHGFVFDSATGNVVNLNVSFGPPGQPIPPVPFAAVEAAKNYQARKGAPKFFKGKTLPKKTN